jgi:hypothetical protein
MSDPIWKQIPGYEGFYEVSDAGQIRRSERPNRLLKHVIGTGGYHEVHPSVNGRRKNLRVHLAVLAAFLGPKPVGKHGCHNNGNPDDNRLLNLRYDTPSANAFDSLAHGTCYQAEKQYCPAGHAYDEKNTRYVKTTFGSGVGRQCRTCDKARQSAKRAADRDSYNAAARERRQRQKRESG